MGAGYIYVCSNCGKLVIHEYGRDPDLECPHCGQRLVYLCSETNWAKLNDREKWSLVSREAPHAKMEYLSEPQHYWNSQPDTCNTDYRISSSVVALLFGLAGAVLFVFAGMQMLGITSVSVAHGSDGSVMEAFYHAMGFLCFGLACISVLLGYMGWKK